jgi:hypothetical protein
MSETLIAFDVDAETGIVTERELTSDELAIHEQILADQAQAEAQALATAKARASALAKLKKLGLTAAEIEAL